MPRCALPRNADPSPGQALPCHRSLRSALPRPRLAKQFHCFANHCQSAASPCTAWPIHCFAEHYCALPCQSVASPSSAQLLQSLASQTTHCQSAAWPCTALLCLAHPLLRIALLGTALPIQCAAQHCSSSAWRIRAMHIPRCAFRRGALPVRCAASLFQRTSVHCFAPPSLGFAEPQLRFATPPQSTASPLLRAAELSHFVAVLLQAHPMPFCA